MGQNQTKVASNEEEIAAKALEDDEPDDWDKRIFSTGCASRLGLGLFRELLAEARSTEEQTNMNDCYFDKKDWRVCSQEVPPSPTTQSLQEGLDDLPAVLDETTTQVDWAHSFHGLSTEPFSKEAAEVLLQPITPQDIEVKPDGIIYLPEIKYRRILNKAFGPGGWGLAPRGETIVTAKAVTREYALVALGRLVSVARGEQDYFSPDGIPTAAEGCKSNALLRCCKDLGVASELWDPVFIRQFKKEHVKELWVEHINTKQKKKIWLRKDTQVGYPFKETKAFGGS
ncbi:hypothetical protein MMC30_000502 [Trapelia coarctata]|nr:hypothetical protein [Trapelia coarctata]